MYLFGKIRSSDSFVNGLLTKHNGGQIKKDICIHELEFKRENLSSIETSSQDHKIMVIDNQLMQDQN